MLGKLKIVVAALVVLAGAVGGAFALGVFGTPSVQSVDNRFVSVDEETTKIGTNLTVDNPNPVGVSLGGVRINYSVAMNDVRIATGDKSGVSIGTGNSTVPFTTRMQNSKIPAWWVTHIRNGETTEVSIDAQVTSSTLGQSVPVSQTKTIQTDIAAQFNSTETRPVNANKAFVSDPVLYINETAGSWDRGGVTAETTPLDLSFTVYNPKPYPYTVSKIGYEITMNNITVGQGETEQGYVIGPGGTETLRAGTAIRNENLDRWWVSHLQRNQNTRLFIDFYFVLEGNGESYRIDVDSIDYEKSIETDIFGNKDRYPTGDPVAGDGGAETATATATPTPTPTDEGILDDGTDTATATDTKTDSDDGILGGDTDTATPTPTPTPTPAPTPTATETDNGTLL